MNGRAEVSRLRMRLDATFSRVPSSSADLETQADYAKYLCVLVSGFFENAIVALILYYAEQRSAPEIASFVERQLDRWTNPNSEKISSLFGSFNTDWREALEGYLVDERKDSVNSLVALRHKIAHGESIGTSLSQVKAHYKVILEVVNFLADLTQPP
jgi:hypothetical protein